MFRWAVVPLLIAWCVGCQQAVDEVQNAGNRVARNAQHAFSESMNQIQHEADQASDKSSKESLDALKTKLEQAKETISNAKVPDQLKLDSIKAQLEKVDAAAEVRAIREKLDKKVHEAMELKDNAGKTYNDVRSKLEEADRSFRQLSDKLDDAKSTYSAAEKTVKETVAKAKETAGITP